MTDDVTTDSTTLPVSEAIDLSEQELFPEREHIGMRLDRYVSSAIDDLSRTYLQTLIDDGHVLVDGIERRAAFKITPGQRVTVRIPEVIAFDAEPEDLPLDILFANDDVVVLNKAPGMVVHPAPGHPHGTLVNALLHHYPDISISGTNRPGSCIVSTRTRLE